MFRLSNTARKIFWVARIFDATLPNFTNGRAIAPPAPLSPTPMLVTQPRPNEIEIRRKVVKQPAIARFSGILSVIVF